MPQQRRKPTGPVEPVEDEGCILDEEVYVLTFEDEDMARLVVKAVGPSIAAFVDISAQVGKNLGPDDLLCQFGHFADALVSWNLRNRRGEAVPPTLEGIYTQQPKFIMRIVNAWVDAATGVDAPLEQSSPGGAPSEELSIPMETLSENRAS